MNVLRGKAMKFLPISKLYSSCPSVSPPPYLSPSPSPHPLPSPVLLVYTRRKRPALLPPGRSDGVLRPPLCPQWTEPRAADGDGEKEKEKEEEDGQGVAKCRVGPEASVDYGHHVQEDDDGNISTNGDRSRVFFRSSLEKEDVVERNGDTVPSSKRKHADAFVCYAVKRKRNLLKESVRKRDGNSVSIALNQQTSSQKAVFRSWKEVNLAGVNPDILVGRKCKVDYDDGDEENLLLAKESVKLYLSHDEWRFLTQQSHSATLGKKKIDYQEIAALAAGVEVHGEYGHGEVVWVKIKGAYFRTADMVCISVG